MSWGGWSSRINGQTYIGYLSGVDLEVQRVSNPSTHVSQQIITLQRHRRSPVPNMDAELFRENCWTIKKHPVGISPTLRKKKKKDSSYDHKRGRNMLREFLKTTCVKGKI